MAVSEMDYVRMLEIVSEAILDPSKWIELLQLLASVTGCVGGGLTLEDAHSGIGNPIDYFGFDEGHVAKTWHHYLPQNPLFSIAPKLQTGFVVTNSMVVPEATFKKSEFYDGWARPQGICSPATVVLHRSGSVYVPLTLIRADGHGDMDDEGLDLLRKLAPALTRAFAITMRLERFKNREAAFQEAMSRLAFAVILTDANDQVVFANDMADDLLRTGEIFAVRRNRLLALHGATADFDAAVANPPAQFVARHPDGRSMFCIVLPLQQATSFVADEPAATRMIILGPQKIDHVLAGDALAAAHGLTAAEQAVLNSLLRGEEPAATAAVLGVNITTVRTHLLRIFAKTGIHRQSELMRLAWSMTPPARRH